MRNCFRDIFTDGSGTSVDYGKVMGAIAFSFFMLLSLYNYGFKGSTWDPGNWSLAVVTLLGGIVGVSKVKDFTVKNPEDKVDG